MFQNVKKRASRRGWPIMAYVGANGSGKSACMVWDTLPSLESGRPVLSTVRLLDYENPRPCDDPTCGHPEHSPVLFAPVAGGQPINLDGGIPLDRAYPLEPTAPVITHRAAHPLYVPFKRWDQLLDATHCDVLMDEVTGVASSRDSAAMPSIVANFLVQLRRSDVVLRWSTPNWQRADKIIRETTQGATVCKGFLPVSVEAEDGDPERAWRQRRFFKWTTYDAADVEDLTAGKRDSMTPWQRDFHWGPTSPVFGAYDTLDAVERIGTVTDSGRCYQCGGNRPIPKCSCPPDEGRLVEVAPPVRGRRVRQLANT